MLFVSYFVRFVRIKFPQNSTLFYTVRWSICIYFMTLSNQFSWFKNVLTLHVCLRVCLHRNSLAYVSLLCVFVYIYMCVCLSSVVLCICDSFVSHLFACLLVCRGCVVVLPNHTQAFLSFFPLFFFFFLSALTYCVCCICVCCHSLVFFVCLSVCVCLVCYRLCRSSVFLSFYERKISILIDLKKKKHSVFVLVIKLETWTNSINMVLLLFCLWIVCICHLLFLQFFVFFLNRCAKFDFLFINGHFRKWILNCSNNTEKRKGRSHCGCMWFMFCLSFVRVLRVCECVCLVLFECLFVFIPSFSLFF